MATKLALINQRIKNSLHEAFTTADFLDIANYKLVSKALELLEDRKIIKRARRGVYYKSRFNETLKMETSVNMDEVAKAIARQYNWTIVPSGIYALNLIGLSTQVPNKIVYISTGPYVKYNVGNNQIIFKHSTSKEISNNIVIATVIQAMKEIGKNNISNDILEKIYFYISKGNTLDLINNVKTTAWINDYLRRIYVQYSETKK